MHITIIEDTHAGVFMLSPEHAPNPGGERERLPGGKKTSQPDEA
jgi:hypothetical protein